MPERQYDLALFGATGFTGGLTARYLAANAPASLRWALVGRNRDKLGSVASSLAAVAADGVPAPELLIADAADAAALARVAGAARVVITTVGPYALHGEPLVAACAAAGTDYVDLTGEPEFVDRMWLDYHEQAQRSGARLVHCCGFDSIPHDLGAYFTVKQLPEGVPLTVNGYVRMGAEFSGGTFASAINGFGRARQTVSAARRRRQREPGPAGRRVRSAPPRPRRDAALGGWVVPLPTIDGPIVRRSAAALERYGPDFRYGHNVVARHLASVAATAGGIGAALVLAQLPPTRKLLLRSSRAPGEGPSEEVRSKSWFKVTFVGEGGGRRVVTEVAGGDPGYDETAKMLAESGLCLAFDELPETAGQVTTAQAMGDALLERLQRAGIGFRLLESADASAADAS
ncbi:MAG TPA: saccharopine dehydrogenase NADP-binding domain-containing protein [Solirubrobacterales bacterium]|nr:saccharopine dehydrogenase NADP-binding domain-containing protein [Solirubrobacterales bacterium]